MVVDTDWFDVDAYLSRIARRRDVRYYTSFWRYFHRRMRYIPSLKRRMSTLYGIFGDDRMCQET